jgi:hypothetical protein
VQPANEDEIVRVHDALDELAKVDPRLVQVVEMRYFAGLAVSLHRSRAELNVTSELVYLAQDKHAPKD